MLQLQDAGCLGRIISPWATNVTVVVSLIINLSSKNISAWNKEEWDIYYTKDATQSTFCFIYEEAFQEFKIYFFPSNYTTIIINYTVNFLINLIRLKKCNLINENWKQFRCVASETMSINVTCSKFFIKTKSKPEMKDY